MSRSTICRFITREKRIMVANFRNYNNKIFSLVCLSSFVFSLYIIFNVLETYQNMSSADNVILYRDLLQQEAWPEIESNQTLPGTLPSDVHYFWCGNKIFRFEDYLSILSIVRILKPRKLIFHYSSLPKVDDMWYHTWFQELKQSLPYLVLQKNFLNYKCGSVEALRYYLSFLEAEGGIYVGERTLITHLPEVEKSDIFFSFQVNEIREDVTQGIVIANHGFSHIVLDNLINNILTSANTCTDIGSYNQDFSVSLTVNGASNERIKNSSTHSTFSSSLCIILSESIYPKDILDSPTRFAELARWLFYGERRLRIISPDPPEVPLIPLISHMVWLKPTDPLDSTEFQFIHFMSVISAIYVAGFQHIYIHGTIKPYGHWWEELSVENVTFVSISHPETIFQQTVFGPAHQSDIIRLNILNTYGGAYQDRDVIWVSKISESIRRYPVVACPDWPINGEWPEVLNMGVILAKPGATWLSQFIKTFRYYRDDKWAFNAVFMPYKTYEFHPELIYIDRHLQIICFSGICHPAWHKDYKRDIFDTRPVTSFHWNEGRALHFTVTTPDFGLSSLDTVKSSSDKFSEIGQMILKKAGRSYLLE